MDSKQFSYLTTPAGERLYLVPEPEFNILLNESINLSETSTSRQSSKEKNQLNWLDLRLKAGLSQERLGELAGITQAQISRIENGRAKPQALTRQNLLSVLEKK